MASDALKDNSNLATPIRPPTAKGEMMKAVAWWGKKNMRIIEVERPTIAHPHDVILRVTSTAICGSDLHIYQGTMPRTAMQKGDIMGHEFMGYVHEVGSQVKGLKPGDRVVACFDISCGSCSSCERQLYSCCDKTNNSIAEETMYGDRTAGFFGYSHLTGGWPGGQAEYVRVPFGELNLLKIDNKTAPRKTSDLDLLFLSDILSTAWHANEMGEVGEGDVVAIWGSGPVGILAAHCAQHRKASKVILIDRLAYRLSFAEKRLDSNTLVTINASETDVRKTVRDIVANGPDVAIEAAGFDYASTLVHKAEIALSMETDTSEILNEIFMTVRKGGRVSVVGVYVGFANHFNIGCFMEKGLTMKGGQTHVQRYWRTLLEKVQAGQLNPKMVLTHELPLDQAPQGYDIFFKKDEKDKCVKVVLHTKFFTGEYVTNASGKRDQPYQPE